MVDGYFRSKSVRCTCSLTSEGYPKGRAQWYKEDGQTVGAGGALDVTYDKNSECRNHNGVRVYRQLIDLRIDANTFCLL